MPRRSLRLLAALLGSGWTPAALVLLLTAVCLHVVARVAIGDLALFAGYALGWLLMPGTLAWRAIDRRAGPRPLVADLSIGMLCGYVLEFPTYLVCLALGHPQAYVLWPVIVLLATVTHRRGRALWTRPTSAMPRWWSWSVAGVSGWMIAWYAWAIMRVYPVSGRELRWLYSDEYHHLMLAGELRHHFPPQNANVAGTALHYHWLSHLHVAASSWVTGIEPIVLLQGIALPAMCLALFVAFACVVTRIGAVAWAGPVGLLFLVIGPGNLSGWDPVGIGLLAPYLSISPSAGFVVGPLLLGLLVCVELLRGRLTGPLAYAFATLCFVAMLGAKSTSLPIVLFGLALVTGWTLLAERRLHRPAVALTSLALVAYLVAKPFFFGSGTGGVEVSVLGTFGDGPWVDRLLMAAVYLLGYLAIGAPLILALALRRGGEHSTALLLTGGAALAGFAGKILTVAPRGSEFYFMYAGLLPLALGSALALPRLVPTRWTVSTEPGGLRRPALWLLALAVAIATAARIAVALASRGDAAAPTGLLHRYVVPNVVGWLIAATAAALWWLLASRRAVLRSGLLVATTALLGLGGVSVAATVTAVAHRPLARPAEPAFAEIGDGGIESARWLRDRSSPGTLVATNAHCSYPPVAVAPANCQQRNFWMAGFSERRFLVEGWSYINRGSQVDTSGGPFWDEALLSANDLAFRRPTAERIRLLHEQYGVQWLFVDLRYPADLAALEQLVPPAHRRGDYVVFDLRDGVMDR